MTITIRQERPEDYTFTEKLIAQAFLNATHSDQTEHLLVQRLRKSGAFVPELSLVATRSDDEILGHIMLSKITIGDHNNRADSLALAPVPLAPDYQNLGIGSQLKNRHRYRVASEAGLNGMAVQAAMAIFTVNLKRILRLLDDRRELDEQ